MRRQGSTRKGDNDHIMNIHNTSQQYYPEKTGVKVYVLFYARENDEPMKGVMGYFQDKLQYWHCEIAFPLESFDPSSLPVPPEGVARRSLIWAYGIMNQTKECFPSGEILMQDDDQIIIDPNVHAPVSAETMKKDVIIINVGSGGIKKETREVEELDSAQNLVKVQYQILKCTSGSWVRCLAGKTEPSTIWPSGVEIPGEVEVRIRNVDGLITLITPGTVFGKYRTFSRPNYKWLTFVVPWADAAKAVQYCTSQVGKKYDHNGIKRSMFWPAKHQLNPSKVYCVNVVTSALQQAKIARGYNPNGLTTDDLYNILVNHPGTKVKSVLPYTEEQFIKNTSTASKRTDIRAVRSNIPKNKKEAKEKKNKARFKGSILKPKTLKEIEREYCDNV